MDVERTLRELSEKATPGPWTLYEDTCRVCREENTSEWGIPGVDRGHHAMFSGKENAEFVVACVNYVTMLLADRARCQRYGIMSRCRIQEDIQSPAPSVEGKQEPGAEAAPATHKYIPGDEDGGGCCEHDDPRHPSHIGAAAGESTELRAALLKYGKHLPDCRKREWLCSQPECGETHSTACSCGLDAASQERSAFDGLAATPSAFDPPSPARLKRLEEEK